MSAPSAITATHSLDIPLDEAETVQKILLEEKFKKNCEYGYGTPPIPHVFPRRSTRNERLKVCLEHARQGQRHTYYSVDFRNKLEVWQPPIDFLSMMEKKKKMETRRKLKSKVKTLFDSRTHTRIQLNELKET